MANLLTTTIGQVRLTVPEASALPEDNNITYYSIKVEVGRVHWRVRRRYNDFSDLHSKLVAKYGLVRTSLPEKRFIGNRQPSFILKRRRELEEYLNIAITFTTNNNSTMVVDEFVEFLDLQKYDAHFITKARLKVIEENNDEEDNDNHASNECSVDDDTSVDQCNADCKLSSSIWTPLHLYSLRESLKSPSTSSSEEMLTTVADRACSMHNLKVVGSDDFVGTSNIVSNNLVFDLLTFKSLTTLTIINVPILNLVRGLGSLRGSLKRLAAHKCQLTTVQEALLCDYYNNKSIGSVVTVSDIDGKNTDTSNNVVVNEEAKWPCLRYLDLRRNAIKSFDGVVISLLAPNIETLILGKNNLATIPNVSALSNLERLDLSENNLEIRQDEELNERVNQLHRLDLQGNHITSTSALSNLHHLKHLNLSNNRITDLEKVRVLGYLESLMQLQLQGNPVCNVVDYRLKVLENFGKRACDIVLDHLKPSRGEIDKVAVLMALRVAKEGRPPTSLFGNLPSCG